MAQPIIVEPDDDDPVTPPPAAAPPAPPMPGPPAAPPAPPVATPVAPAAPPAATEPTVGELQEQLSKLQAAIARNNSELAKRRHTEKLMRQHNIDDLGAWLQERGIDPSTGLPIGQAPPAADGTPVDQAEVERQIQLRIEQETVKHTERSTALEQALRSTAIEAALRAAKFAGTMERAKDSDQPSGLERALRVMDLSTIEIGPDGRVTGATEAVQALREEIPEWFRQTPPTPPPPRRGPVDGGDRRPAPPARPKWDEQVVERWRKGR